ncbi:MAG: hypothetical protein WCG80_01565 [Spirochaetales bacterium]
MKRGTKRLITRKEWRLFWIVSLGLSALAGGGTATYLFLNKPEEPKNQLPSQSPFKQNIDDTIPDALGLKDFVFAAPGGQWLTRSWLYSRQGAQKWTPAEIAPYWTPVEQIPLLQLPETNDQLLERFFEDVH